MTSRDGLALLKQMYQRGELTDAQYDALRRHVLWGTPVPQLEDDLPVPRSGADPVGGYVPGAATVGPERAPRPPGRYAGEPAGHPAGPVQPSGPAPRRYASRRERREAEEARAHPPPPAHLSPAESTGPLPPVGGGPPQRRRHRRDDVDSRAPDAGPAPTYEPSAGRDRRAAPAAGPDELTTRRAGEIDPDRRYRAGNEAAAGTRTAGKKKRRPRRRSVVAVLTSVVLALALAAGGVYWFELRREGLPPAAYARQACAAVRDWQQAVDSSNAKLIDQISRQQNEAVTRSDVTAYYTTIAGRTDQLRVTILDLRPADVAGGREYADSLAAAVGDQATGLRRLAGRAARLDPAAATFPTDLQGILTGADTAVSVVSAALARPAAGITTELRTTLSNEPACAPYVG